MMSSPIAEVKLEQVRLAYKQLPAGITSTLLSICLTILLLLDHVPGRCLAYWSCFGFAVSTCRLIVYQLFLKIQPGKDKIEIWIRYFLWTTVATGIFFGSVGWFLFSIEKQSLQIFIIFLIGGTTAGAIGTIGCFELAYRLYVLLATIPVIASLLIIGGEVNNGIAALFTIFTLLILRAARDVNGSIMKSLNLGFKNKELVETLSVANKTISEVNLNLQHEVRVHQEEVGFRRKRETELRNQQETLLKITRFEADHQGDLESILFYILESASLTLHVTKTVLWRIDDTGAKMEAVSVFPGSSFSACSLEISRNQFPEFFNVVERELLLITKDVVSDARVVRVAEYCFAQFNVSSMLGASLRVGGSPLGIVLFLQEHDVREWTLEEQNFVATLSEMIAHSMDQHQRMEIESALFDSQERAQVTLESIGDGVLTTDLYGVIEYLNPVAERQTGWSLDEASGKHIDQVFKLLNESTGSVIHNVLESFMDPGSARLLTSGLILFDRCGQREYSVEVTVSPIRQRDNREIGRVVVFHDITDLRVMTRRVSYQATHDTLTGLVNRREFENQLGLALYSARVEKKNHVLLYLDLDQFKVVNDTCGHLAGDELLKQVSVRLSHRLRENDSLARLGGDEFGILLRGCKLEDARLVAEKLCQELRELRFDWQGRIFSIGVSIGLAPILAETNDMSEIMSAADAACYMAKDDGRNRVHVYLPDDKNMARWHGEMQWVHRINHALAEGRLLLFYQPVMPVFKENNANWYCEFLLRMRDENNEIVSPMSFIPAAERYQMMTLLDRWVFETLINAQEKGHPVLARYAICALNISGQSLCDEKFLDFVLSTFQTYKVDPSKFCFEITETAAVSNFRKASLFIDNVTRIGCSMALDDFGSGLSSFGYLKGLNVDFLKIDGSFVKDMVNDPIDRAMVESINQIGHVMKKKTIAEFVENDEILEQLRVLGVDYAQGYGIEKPKPL